MNGLVQPSLSAERPELGQHSDIVGGNAIDLKQFVPVKRTRATGTLLLSRLRSRIVRGLFREASKVAQLADEQRAAGHKM